MADNEIQHAAATGGTYYAVILNGTSQAWNGSAFETVADANWATYDVALTQEGTVAPIYAAVFPSGITTIANYTVFIFSQSGGTPAVGDTIDGIGNFFWDGTTLSAPSATPAQVWANPTRTNTTPTGATLSNLNAGELGLLRNATFSQSITGLGSLANGTNEKVIFTVKVNKEDLDADAIIKIGETTGLIVLNGSTSVTAGNASITEDDASAGDITVVLNAAECGQLTVGEYFYDVKITRSSGTPVSVLGTGMLIVTDTVGDIVS